MYTRTLTSYNHAFFLFGPRGTGKSTWLAQQFKEALFIDLLPNNQFLRYVANPSILQAKVKALPKDSWIVIDEIQRVPALLDEVHHLMETQGYKKFVLTGSSARKLKRGAANLLAGRAYTQHLFPLTSHELNHDYDAADVLNYGLLPLSVTSDSKLHKEAFLEAYLNTYILEEVKAEALVKDIGAFIRFVEVSALCAGQQVNISAIARDVMTSRDTVQGYFSILEDTLLGSWLPAFRPRAKIKEVQQAKFYWFDTGVLCAAAGGLTQPLPQDFQGILLEHWIHHELKSYLSYNQHKGSLGFWRTPQGNEVDFIWWYGKKVVAIEVKRAKAFKRNFLKGLQAMQGSNLEIEGAYIVYLGDEELVVEDVSILPVKTFLRKLHNNQIICESYYSNT